MNDLVSLFYNADPDIMICNYLSVLLVIALFSGIAGLLGSIRR